MLKSPMAAAPAASALKLIPAIGMALLLTSKTATNALVAAPLIVVVATFPSVSVSSQMKFPAPTVQATLAWIPRVKPGSVNVAEMVSEA
ncbi:hypothetical protein C8F01DRAFT_1158769 [Mycena amicta]|nr:hypothetical protein C8F01DRAFT_1158769 [Mycena amicta]